MASGRCYTDAVMSHKDREELRKLYPELNEEQLEEAYDTLTRSAELLVRIVERRDTDRQGVKLDKATKLVFAVRQLFSLPISRSLLPPCSTLPGP